LAGAVAAPLAGILADRIGARLPVVVGLAVMAVSSLFLGMLSLDTPVVAIALVVGLQGFGNGLALTPNQVAGMNALPQRLLARGTAIRSTTRQVAGSFSVALLTAFLVSRIGLIDRPTDPAAAAADQAGFNLVFLACAGVAAACLLIAIRYTPDADVMERDTKDRAVEHKAVVARG
jgi:MFS family permease